MTEHKPVMPEPWLRGTLTDVPAVARAVLHALELAKEDLWKWCFPLSEQELHHRPGQNASVAFYLRHIAGSLDRLLTYAEGATLSEAQLLELRAELESPASKHDELFAHLEHALARSHQRVRALGSQDLETPRVVGRKRLPTTIGGLLVHVADHTQRHVGQAITTAKFVAHR
ncbi:MAG: DinB family protein [Candidatus Acidiferrum sp.]